MASIVAARRGRILVVDDQRSNVEMLAELLRSRGYLVDGVYDGETALQKVAEMKPDLVISDIRMPGRDGIALLAELRQTRPDTPVIVTSESGSTEGSCRAATAGAAPRRSRPRSPAGRTRSCSRPGG